MIQEENSGLTIVHPVDRIKEVVELEWARIEAQKKAANNVIKYSDGNEARELLLEEVSVWSKADGEYKMEEVYLSRLPSEFSIEIDNYNKGDNA